MHEDGDFRLGTFGEEVGANSFAETCRVLDLVAHDGHGEVDGFADGFLRRSDGVEARLEFAEDFDKFLGREFRSGDFFQDVGDIASPEEIFQGGFFLGLEKIGQKSSGAVLFGDGLEKLFGRFCDDVA